MSTLSLHFDENKTGYFRSVLFIVIFICLASCSSNKKSAEGVTELINEEFHADNDIVMVVRSIVDAITVGENLSPGDYDFKGILTDGQGTPLYTDLMGDPGYWEVDVLSDKKVVIRNSDLGDLLPFDLQVYILQGLNIDPEANIIPALPILEDEENHLYSSLYNFGSGYLLFEIKEAIIEEELEGTFMTILLSEDFPQSDETQTDV